MSITHEVAFQITINVEKVERNELFLSQFVGNGEFDGVPLEISVTLPACSPIITVDGERYLINIHDIAGAVAETVLDLRKENQ